MELQKFYIEPELWERLGEIAEDMDKKGINVRVQKTSVSKAAALRQLIRDYDLPAKPKNTPKSSS